MNSRTHDEIIVIPEYSIVERNNWGYKHVDTVREAETTETYLYLTQLSIAHDDIIVTTEHST